MKLDALFRTAAILSMLVAGSCSVANDGTTISEDGARNHPITVEPSYRDLKLQYTGGGEGLSADDAIKFDAFLADYRTHGNGSLGISVANGTAAHAAITFFAERAAATGISRDKTPSPILNRSPNIRNGADSCTPMRKAPATVLVTRAATSPVAGTSPGANSV